MGNDEKGFDDQIDQRPLKFIKLAS